MLQTFTTPIVLQLLTSTKVYCMPEPHIDLVLACAPIRATLGRRRARDASLSLYKTLARYIPPEEARMLASAITGQPPDPNMSIGEVLRTIRKAGIKLSRNTLYRLVKKSRGQETRIKINSRGQWEHADYAGLEDPIFELSAFCEGPFTRFRLVDLRQNS